MPRKTKAEPKSKPIAAYTHADKERVNNPPIGLVTPRTDPERDDKTYQYDPHLDPQLQWAGKTEHTSFTVPTVSLHVHERIEPKTILDAVKKAKDDGGQLSMFADARPLREAIEFYKHKDEWSNRLIAGDSLLVMNSLLEKEGYAGKVQMVYFDPPYGIKYGSNFQPFVNKRDVKDGNDGDLTAEPEMIKAFRDTWELGIHSYLTYLRDRLLLARELLNESGSIFVQISDENVHHVREIMDEVFGGENFISLIAYKRSSGFETKFIANLYDYIIWYSKDRNIQKYNQLFIDKNIGTETYYDKVELSNGEIKSISDINGDIPTNSRFLLYQPLVSSGYSENLTYEYEHNEKKYHCGANRHWKTTEKGLLNLSLKNRIYSSENTLKFIRYHDDYPVTPLSNSWDDTVNLIEKAYVVQTNPKAIQRCLLMTTDPGDLVLDITCGSGTTAYVAEQWGRRWITCDTSRVALTLAKQRLLTAVFDYYQLAKPQEGIASGFVYKTVPHITLKSLANNEPPATETLYDQPLKDTSKSRITGPFTVEAVPAPSVLSLESLLDNETNANAPLETANSSVARSGATYRHNEWRDELLKTGVRAKNGQVIHFSRVETLIGAKFIQAIAETKEELPKKVLIVFGPEFAPLTKKMVEQAIDDARVLKPNILLFCAFAFEDEAAKDIDETSEQLLGFKLLKAQMNADLLTEDLRKNRSSNESFWLIGQPDIKVIELPNGMLQVEVLGFDYYNPKTGNIDSGGKNNIAMWLLDTDYDGRSLFPRQVFFPMAGGGEGWDKLAKNLKAELDLDKIEAFSGTVSLPFAHSDRIAVKIVDDRGIESYKHIAAMRLQMSLRDKAA